MMSLDRRKRPQKAKIAAAIGLLPILLAAPVEPADRGPDGAGGPLLPKTIARSAEHLQPKLTLAVHHRSYRMESAGPILFPEGGLELSLRDLSALPEGESEARLGITYSIPTATVQPPVNRRWVLSYMPPSVSSDVGLPDAGAVVAGQRTVELLFERQGSLLDEDAAELLDDLAERALKSGTRVQILAYAGDVNDRSSAARRLALRRGLAVRTYLHERGVPKTRMSVHPIGGVGDTGPLDRVDIVLSAG